MYWPLKKTDGAPEVVHVACQMVRVGELPPLCACGGEDKLHFKIWETVFLVIFRAFRISKELNRYLRKFIKLGIVL